MTSAVGRSGGWRIAKGADEITLEQIHDALQTGSAFSIALSSDHSTCPVKGAVNTFLDQAMADAERALRTRFASTTIQDLANIRLVWNAAPTQSVSGTALPMLRPLHAPGAWSSKRG